MIRILIVDDQEAVREVLEKKLNEFPEFQVVGKAKDGLEALELLDKTNPNVITLDVFMPKIDGITLLKIIRAKRETPVIMLSAYTQEGSKATIEALRSGAFDFVQKPDGSPEDFERMLIELKEKIIQAFYATYQFAFTKRQEEIRSFLNQYYEKQKNKRNIQIIAIGSSTGGIQAIETILRGLPPSVPGILIVQHMPAHFTKLLAERLDMEVSLEVREAKDGDTIEKGKVLIAPGNYHMALNPVISNQSLTVRVYSGEKVSGHRPSVNVLFESIAESGIADQTIGIILTGMGKDGAIGMEKMKAKGSYNIGQDEKTSVVFGMPKEAWEVGALDELLPIDQISRKIIEITGL